MAAAPQKLKLCFMCEKQGSARQKDKQLKPLAPPYEPRQGASGSRGWRLPQVLVSSGWHSIELRLHHLLPFPHSYQVGHWLALFLHAVENLLTIQVHFEPAVCTRGQRNSYISTKGTKEFVRHPRGGREMFSTDTVHDVY